MVRFRASSILLSAAFLAAVCAPIGAQTVRVIDAKEPQERPISVRVPATLFDADSKDPAHLHFIAYRKAEEMTKRDKLVAAGAESAIQEHAGIMELGLEQGNWSYQQVVCPAVPNHLFLRYMRNNGTGDVTMFTASIPRGNLGRVRIIPIQMRGYSLFSPAPINAITVGVFNRIREEEEMTQKPDWLGTGLCYAALAGGDPKLGQMREDSVTAQVQTATPATLTLENNGGAEISFADVAGTRPMEWRMIFDPKGKLLKAMHAPAQLIVARNIHPKAVDQRGITVQENAPGVVSTPIPPAPPTVVGKPIPPTDIRKLPSTTAPKASIQLSPGQ
jgi:hypothetical protein